MTAPKLTQAGLQALEWVANECAPTGSVLPFSASDLSALERVGLIVFRSGAGKWRITDAGRERMAQEKRAQDNAEFAKRGDHGGSPGIAEEMGEIRAALKDGAK